MMKFKKFNWGHGVQFWNGWFNVFIIAVVFAVVWKQTFWIVMTFWSSCGFVCKVLQDAWMSINTWRNLKKYSPFPCQSINRCTATTGTHLTCPVWLVCPLRPPVLPRHLWVSRSYSEADSWEGQSTIRMNSTNKRQMSTFNLE